MLFYLDLIYCVQNIIIILISFHLLETNLIFFSLNSVQLQLGADTGGAGDIRPPTDSGRGLAPPEFGILCSLFQNSFSIACLWERNPSAKQEKYLS